MEGGSPYLDEGSSAAPGISPGVVSDCERLLRELYAPHHTDDQGGQELTVRAIAVKELREKGFSVNRQKHVRAECVKELIDERLAIPRKGQPWKSLGVARLKARDVRALRLDEDDAEQVLVVVDTATDERPWHASIYAKQEDATVSRCRELRELLLPLLRCGQMPVEEAYGTMETERKGRVWRIVQRLRGWSRGWRERWRRSPPS